MPSPALSLKFASAMPEQLTISITVGPAAGMITILHAAGGAEVHTVPARATAN